MLILILAVAFLVLLFLTFRAPGAPRLDRLIFFLLLVAVSVILVYQLAVRLLGYDPDPDRLRLARWLTEEKIIDFTQIVPGLPEDLDLIKRIDVDEVEEDQEEEWLVLYRYDEVVRGEQVIAGPFGAAIYDVDTCRPPAILKYELSTQNRDYLSLDLPWITDDPDTSDVVVNNIIQHQEQYGPECARPGLGPDRKELVVFGRTNGVRTDLNIFRKTGQELTCVERQRWESTYPYRGFPCPLTYENIGSWRANYNVVLSGQTVITYDRAPFERSVLVVKRTYRPDPNTGSYFKPTQEAAAPKVLIDPVEVGIVFGPGAPEDTQQVFYPEKTVLAFFLQLGTDVDEAMDNVCDGSPTRYDPANFGLTLPQSQLEKVTVCEIRYNPDVISERNHLPQHVGVRVVEVPAGGTSNCNEGRLLTCTVQAEEDPGALPYGCQWCLSGCVAAGP